MKQYIDKDAIVAEIERIKKEECPIDTYEGRTKLFYFEQFLSFLDKLEVKEVDLKKEYDNFQDLTLARLVNRNAGMVIAKHFFELGLNVSNPTSQNVQDLIEKYVSDHAANRWLDASELEKLLNDFVVEYNKIRNHAYEQQCKCKSE